MIDAKGAFGVTRIGFILVSFLALTACKSSEDKAEAYVQSAIELSSRGEVRGAILDLKNAIRLDEHNVAARKLYAQLLFETGEISRAYREYKYVSEAQPNDLDAVRAMAGIAFDSNDLDGAQSFLSKAQAIDDEDIGVREIAVGLAYRDAAKARDDAAMDLAAREAEAILDLNAEAVRARRVVIASLIRTGQTEEALSVIDEGLALTPEDRALHNTKLLALNELGHMEETRAHILTMISLDPDDIATQRLLMDWYLTQDRVDEAEAWLKGRIDDESANAMPRLTYLRFLSQLRSNAVMRNELRALLVMDPLPHDVAENLDLFRALLAGADYIAGDTDQAMADLERLIEGKESDAKLDQIKMQLSVMYRETGNAARARALIEEVLAHDAGQLMALKEKAQWLISDGDIDNAILVLRSALGDAPDDPELFSLLATAYERDGKRQLMSDMLARAVEASNNAPDESLRFAAVLFQKGEPRLAEKVIEQALRRASRDLRLHNSLARIHLEMRDWPRAARDIDVISQTFSSQEAQEIVADLKAQLLAQQDKSDELTTFLQERADAADSTLGAKIANIRNYLLNGNVEAARERMALVLQDAPDDPNVRLIAAMVEKDAGDPAAAQIAFKTLTQDVPDFVPAWRALAQVTQELESGEAAIEVIEAALEVSAQDRDLRLDYAGRLEQVGRIDEAIAAYDALYAQGSDDLVVANNLASLLTTHRRDTQTVERAYDIAMRLKGTSVPAFQDTFGWAAFLAGNVDEARSALETAAKALPNEALVAYHLGEVYARLGRVEEARAQFERASDLLRNGLDVDPRLRADLAKALETLAQ
ncbi:tetratricopeptide repeat protein [Celeribacter sp.]|uniref:tetratricopeptide repeat protein n=1 Tax=Celeribacter sp. TaxID=1890673 RepID=UPI003A8D9071